MTESNFFSSIRNALFGNARSNARGVQLAEMADARQVAIYFLANTDFVPYPNQLSMSSSIISGIFGEGIFLQDISSLGSALVTKTAVIGTSFGQAVSAAGSLASSAGHKIDDEINHFFVRIIDKLASIFGRFSDKVHGILKSLSSSALAALVGKIISCIPGWS